MDKKKPQKSHFYGEYILEKIIFISCRTSHYLKMPLFIYMSCHLYQSNSRENGTLFNE